MTEGSSGHDFADFVSAHETNLRRALTAAYGADAGREATAEALAYGWQHWDRLCRMDNPTGYLFRVGQSSVKRLRRRSRVVPPAVEPVDEPYLEPGLSAALEHLSERQRIVVSLVHGFDWSLAEVATLLGISKGSVQTYEQRAMTALRRELKVTG